MQSLIPLFLVFVIFALWVRTFLWHLQNWQIREYRFDRMRSYLRTKQGFWGLFTLWFKPGILPRPRKSGRIVLISFIGLMLWALLLWFLLDELISILCWSYDESYVRHFHPEQLPVAIFIGLFIAERFTWIFIALGILISSIPVKIQRKRTFKKAQKIVENAHPNIIKIGISGSFGKSSTKEILYHLLTSEYGKDAVLYNEGNHNNELAIARLIIQNREFFVSEKSKIFLFETGAYKRGEISQITDTVKPEIGILTGLNEQHIELFGSVRNIQLAEFELAESCTKKVFFNSDNELTVDIFEDKKIKATKIPISQNAAGNVISTNHSTSFEIYGELFTLPWPGRFFVQNALLCLETARELGISPKKLSKYLCTLPPQTRALHAKTKHRVTFLYDLYSQNPDGTLKAIEHLAKTKGQKIFFGMPLIELGKGAKATHEQIFRSLRDIDATVYWLKSDFRSQGKKILGDRFHLINPRKPKDIQNLKITYKAIKKTTTILLEGRIPPQILKIFEA